MNQEASSITDPASARKGLKRPAAIIIFAVVVILLVNEAVKSRPLWYWTPVSEPRNLKLYALFNSPEDYDAVVIGSSLSDRGIIPMTIDSELNSALPREKPWRTYDTSMAGALFPAYLSAMRDLARTKHPSLVVLVLGTRDFNTSSHLLGRQMRFHNQSWKDFAETMKGAGVSEQRWPALQALAHGMECMLQAPLRFRSYLDAVRVYQEKQGSVYSWPFNQENIEKNKAFLPDASEFEKLRRERIENYKTELLDNYTTNSLVDYWLGGIVEEARAHDIRLVILMFSESKYLSGNATGGLRGRALARLEPYCGLPGVTCADLQDQKFRPEDSDYFDGCDHLNPAGAAALSAKIGREILVPVLKRATPGAEGR